MIVSKLTASPMEIAFRTLYIRNNEIQIVQKEGRKVTVKMTEEEKKRREREKKNSSKGGGGMPPGGGAPPGFGGGNRGGRNKGGGYGGGEPRVHGGLGGAGFWGGMGVQGEGTIYRRGWRANHKTPAELLA